MSFRPIEKILERAEINGSDSDSVYFTELLYVGEFILKITCASIVAAIQADPQRHKYNLEYRVVRADGIGEWAGVIDDAVVGTASQQFNPDLLEIRRILTERVGDQAWQHEAVRLIMQVISEIKGEKYSIPEKIQFKNWFSNFSELRNKTRGHGATTPAAASRYTPLLRRSIELVVNNNPIFNLPWAYLHRNMSGKYRVVPLGGDQAHFSNLKSSSAIEGENYLSGVYFWARRPIYVELIRTDSDAKDFFIPNGAFSASNQSFELISLITDTRVKGDAGPYLAPPGSRPPSETEGEPEFAVLNNIFSNAPKKSHDYIDRSLIEGRIFELLRNDRHPIVTLVGRGGVGKTSLALAVIEKLSVTDRFTNVIWFSARDIDLLLSGAKPVRPNVLSVKDVADQYVSLVRQLYRDEQFENRSSQSILSGHLNCSPLGSTLFVFDNFETLRSPVDLFNWMDESIRLPNKVLITTRFRDFKADYPVEISGMEREEAFLLMRSLARKLGIDALLKEDNLSEIYDVSDGHPYIMKILIGDIADNGRYTKPGNLIARKDDLLDALFERTFAILSPAASRAFLTLVGWRSPVLRLALEASLLRYSDEYFDVSSAIEQLSKMSLIDTTVGLDGFEIVEVPLSAAIFGKRKLQTSPIRATIESGTRFLQGLGSISTGSTKAGVRPQIERLFQATARKVSAGSTSFTEVKPILEYIAKNYSDAWIFLADLVLEIDRDKYLGVSADYLRRYLEQTPNGSQAAYAWERLVGHYRSIDDAMAALGAFVNLSHIVAPPISQVTEIANLLNNSNSFKSQIDLSERHIVLRPIIVMLERNLQQLSPTDLSRLAWLHLHCGNAVRAREVAELGARIDPENTHCRRLIIRLQS